MSGGFLARWSRRKRGLDDAVPDGPRAAPSTQAVPDAPASPPAVAEPAPESAPDLAALPSLESLTGDSDLAGFLRRGVPEDLRRAALRRVWSLDAGIRDFVGPADYAWDFNAPNGVPGFALELGGEVSQLLAQAIGRVGEATGGEAPAGDVPDTDAPVSVASDQGPGDDVEVEPTMLAEMLPGAEGSAPPDPTLGEVPPEPRRRHGSALPG